MTSLRVSRMQRAIGFVRPFAGSIGFILLLSLGVATINAVEPLILKEIFDELAGTGSGSMVLRAVLGLGGLLLMREALTALIDWLTWRSRLRLHFNLLSASVDQLHRLPIAYHQQSGVGATMTRLDRGIQGFIAAFNEVAFNVIPALVYLAVAIYFMLALDWRLGLVVIAFAPLPAILSRFAAPVQTRRERRLLDRWAAIYKRFNEVLSGIVTVKSFTREDDERDRFLEQVDDANRDVARGVGFDSSMRAIQNLVVAGARLAAIAVGGWLAVRGEVTVGTLVAFLGYVGGLFGPVQGLSNIYQTVHKASVSLDTISDILDAPNTVTDRPGAVELTAVRGDVRFEGIEFGYSGTEQPLLRGIDLEARAGDTIAIVGPSGCGKSTLMALLQRFYDPNAGRITVDGHDIRCFTQRSVRSQMGVVLQDALLFDDTIENNIAYGRPDATQAMISEAARHANALELIMRQPNGWQTKVGERGSRLSAGERQRIAIARALLKDPPILILDEATSALDAESESLVQDALDYLTRNRTTFVIAHRLSTVVSASRIVIIRDGRIAESGTHGELMAAGGYYAGLVERQVGGLLGTA